MRIETPVGEMWLEGGILWHRIDDIVVSEDAARGIENAVRTMTGGKPTPVIVDIRAIGYAKLEVRDFFASFSEDSGEVATALIVGSSASRAMASLFTGHSSPNRPVEVFNTAEDAENWARQFLAEVD